MKRIGNAAAQNRPGQRLRHETNKGASYEYYPIGRYVVIAPGVCGGRPTFKGTRVEVQTILDCMRDGRSMADVLEGYPSISRSALKEALRLAARALTEHSRIPAMRLVISIPAA